MCGIVGFSSRIDNAEAVLGQMMDRIRHRGPDAGGKYLNGEIALGHRRLSIIDITEQGDQPIFNEDRSMVLVFNGEIYNYQEIREELLAAGHSFKTQTDSEVLIHGYEEYGTELLNKLRGMFSFVIWDENKKELFGARDFFGIKPMYYAQMGESFLFGSEIKSFLPHPDFKKELNTETLEQYLTFQYSPTEDTFFKGVKKLPAAHYFLWKDGKLTVQRYWDVHFEADEAPLLGDWVKTISETFHDSVRAHKIADVEVGSFLSSGVDSSYVAAVANVDKTFTVGFGSDEKYNEIGWAKRFSRAIGKENFSHVITQQEYWDVLPKIQYQMDEPLADPSCIALYFVCKLAAEQVKVVLSGEGADELFGGYNVYSEPDGTWYDKLPMGLRRGVANAASVLPAKRGVNFLVRKGRTLEERFIGNAYMFTPAERKALLKIETSAPDPTAVTKPFYDKVTDQDAVTKMQYLDLHLWMTGDILLKADKMSMAHSLELRVPFLDKELMHVAEQIPTRFRVTHRVPTDDHTPYTTKYAMRLAAKRDTPPSTADTAAKKKLGFPVPIRVWLKQDDCYNTVRTAFVSPDAEQFFHTEKLTQLLDDHKNGKADNSRKIWTVYMFLVWYKVYFGDSAA
ncbi:MAG: asparagine synthase (glutamine-hydrolyzing) [Oscillospiraceae bacterium]|nr:asparagine synthase (glutamine-hydrolyzing) [Oscillospiraceae bacterium]